MNRTVSVEESVADWMIEFEKEERIQQGIACPERGYPVREAQFKTIKEWEDHYGIQWYSYIAEVV